MEEEECSDQIVYLYPHLIAAHACLKSVFIYIQQVANLMNRPNYLRNDAVIVIIVFFIPVASVIRLIIRIVHLRVNLAQSPWVISDIINTSYVCLKRAPYISYKH